MRSVYVFSAALMIVLLSCLLGFTGSDLPSRNKTIRIGINFGFTGAASRWAEYARSGAKLAAEESNSTRADDRPHVELVFEDNQSEPAKAVSAYRKLVSIDRVDALIASNWSILTNPLVPLAEQDKKVMLAPTVMDVSLEKKGDYSYAFGPRAESVRPAIREFYLKNPHIKTAAFLSWDDAWGRANAKVWRSVANELGVQVLAESWQSDHSSDFRTEALKVAALKPDVVFVGIYAERVAARLRELKMSPQIFTTDCVHEAIADPGVKRELLQGMYFAEWSPELAFLKTYRKRFGVDPLFEAQNSYEAVRSIVRAYELGHGDISAGIKQVNYQGVAGRIDFTGQQSPNSGVAKLVRIE